MYHHVSASKEDRLPRVHVAFDWAPAAPETLGDWDARMTASNSQQLEAILFGDRIWW